VQEPVGEQVEQQARSTSKSAVSRSFVARTKDALIELMARPLADVRLAVLMIDGVGLKDHTCVVALGITTDGVKIPLGLWEGSTENRTVTAELLSNLVHRGLDVEQGVLVVIDGSKALRAAVNDVLGTRTPVQRCQIHYADSRVMPTRFAGPCAGGQIGPVEVGINAGVGGGWRAHRLRGARHVGSITGAGAGPVGAVRGRVRGGAAGGRLSAGPGRLSVAVDGAPEPLAGR
jgi:hypothetical protein